MTESFFCKFTLLNLEGKGSGCQNNVVVSYFIPSLKNIKVPGYISFFRAAGMKCHKLGDLNNRNLLSDNSGGWKSTSRQQQVWFLPRALKENLLHASFPSFWCFTNSLRHSWAYSASLPSPLHLHMTFSPCVCLCSTFCFS